MLSQVAGFQVDVQVGEPREVIRYPLPTKLKDFRGLKPKNGFLYLDYGPTNDNSNIEVDVVDLRRGILFQLAVGAS